MRSQRASAFQIIATVGIIVAAFLLLTIMTVEKVKKDSISVQQYGKEYTGIIVEKSPRYAEKGSVQGAYQAMYETGMHGGLTNGSASTLHHAMINYSGTEIPVEIWYADYTRQAPLESSVKMNLSEIIVNETNRSAKTFGNIFAIYLGQYGNATSEINRSQKEFNLTLLVENKTAREYTAGGKLSVNASTTSSTKAKIDARYFKLYDLMKYFMENEIFLRVGWGTHNLMASRLEPSPAANPEGLANTPAINDWAKASGGLTAYDPAKHGSGSCANAVPNYTDCPTVTVPTSYANVNESMKTAIGWMNTWLNDDLITGKNASCNEAGCNFTGTYNASRDPYTTGDSYITQRIKWQIRGQKPLDAPADFKTYWDPTDDRYTVLWWNQSASGAATLPDGFAYAQDTQPGGCAYGSSNSQNNNGRQDGSTPLANINQGAPHSNIPEGSAVCDSFYTGCHQLTEYVTWYNAGSPKSYSSCDYSGNVPSPHYTDCSGVTVTSTHYECHGCGESTCCSSWNTYSGISGTRNPWQAHCSVAYDFYAHFKYRAEIDPVLVTIIDLAKMIPVKNIFGQMLTQNPELSAVEAVTVAEEPLCGDGCCDSETGEDEVGSRYYCPGDCPAIGAHPCPQAKNPSPPKTGYYTGTPGSPCSPGCTSDTDAACNDANACTIDTCTGIGSCTAACTHACDLNCNATDVGSCCETGSGKCGDGCIVGCANDAACVTWATSNAKPHPEGWKCSNPGKCSSNCYDAYAAGCRNNDAVCPPGCVNPANAAANPSADPPINDNDCLDPRMPCRSGDNYCPMTPGGSSTPCNPLGWNGASFGDANFADTDCCTLTGATAIPSGTTYNSCGYHHPNKASEVNYFRDSCCPSACTAANDQDCADRAACKSVTTCSLTSDGCCPSTCTAATDKDCCFNAACNSLTPDNCCPNDCTTTNDYDCAHAGGCTAVIACYPKSDGCCPPGCDAKTDPDCCTAASCSLTSSDGCCPSTCSVTTDLDCCNNAACDRITADGCSPAHCTVSDDYDKCQATTTCSGATIDHCCSTAASCSVNATKTNYDVDCCRDASCRRSAADGCKPVDELGAQICSVADDADVCNDAACSLTTIDSCCPASKCSVNATKTNYDVDCCAAAGCINAVADGCKPATCDKTNDKDICDDTGCDKDTADGCCPTGCSKTTDKDCTV